MALQRCVVMVLLPFLLAACAGVPKPQLQTYASAFDELKSAASLIYADAAPALAKGIHKPTMVYPVTLGPLVFDRENCGSVIASYESLRVRCQALLAAKSYNQALLDLSSGKSSQEAVSMVESALKSITSVGVVIGASSISEIVPLVAPLKVILEEALKARDRQAMLDVLLRGESTVRKLISVLRDDIDLLYKVQRAYTTGVLLDVDGAMVKALRPMYDRVTKSGPPADATVARLYAALQQRYEQIFTTPEPTPGFRLKGLNFKQAATPLDAAGVSAVEKSLLDAADYAAQFKATAAQYQQSVQALHRFDTMLTAWDRSLSELIEASRQPFAVNGGTEQAIQSLVVLKEQAREIRRILETK